MQINSIYKALDVLEMLQGNSRELTLTELSKKLDMQKNMAFRLLVTLEERRYVERNARTGNFRLGESVARLRSMFIRHAVLVNHAYPVLQRLKGACDETAGVAVLHEFEPVLLESVLSDQPVRFVPSIGGSLPAYGTAMGKALVSSLPPDRVQQYLERVTFHHYTEKTITDRGRLLEELRATAARGYGLENEELYPGVHSIAMIIHDYDKRTIGAVSLSGLKDRFSRCRMKDELVPLLRNAAREISARFGCMTDAERNYNKAA